MTFTIKMTTVTYCNKSFKFVHIFFFNFHDSINLFNTKKQIMKFLKIFDIRVNSDPNPKGNKKNLRIK